MNFRVGLNNRTLVSDASWGRYGVTETKEEKKEEKPTATLDNTSFRLQTFTSMFVSSIHIFYKILVEIKQVTFNLDTPNADRN